MNQETAFIKLVNPQNKGKDYILGLVIILLSFIFLGQIPLILTSFYYDGLRLDDFKLLMDLNLLFAIILFPFLVGFGAVLFTNRLILRLPFKTLFTVRDKFDWKRFWFSFSVWGGILLLFFIISFFTSDRISFQPKWGDFFILLIISFTILPIQTSFEELFFRSYLFKTFGVVFKKGWITVFVTGALFGLMHGANPEVERIGQILLVYYIVHGLFLGLITLMDDGLELTMGYHAVNNIFASLIVTNDWQAFHTDALFIDSSMPEFGIEHIITLVIIQPLLLILFSKKYNWKNWKEKLFAKIEYPKND